ncbi:PREDICTED: protein FAR1-RELATED SEQUENCE 5-like [Lupinus angustifolius]|uniref:protein FAR1-RELATED SEQUENCE 5-like n=1 Tax=Lupinus angustifolius TaxID=3871 RepID=UPI00092F5A58|nr:PREDICTED: protein FAR1-RELATED SEQUENCE 5-like [Lupinus angustifolius]
MSVAAKSLVEKFEEKGLPTGKVATIFNNDESSFSNRVCWNHVRNLRTKNLDVGDAQAVFDYCKLKESENPNFFYAIQLDDDSQMDSPNIQAFEKEWERIKDDYELANNEWLNELYKIRESWVPIYNRSTFFAGMNTTLRSESINSFFDSFVHATTTLQEFVIKFEKAVDSRLEAERREDYESRHKHCILSNGSKLEEHVASIYTRNIFFKFQDELGKINQFTKVKIKRDGLRHILVIFQAKRIAEIPDHFILQRWTKEANKGFEASYTENNFVAQFTTSKIIRRVHAQQQASILVDLAEESEEMYKFIILELCNTHKSAIATKTNSLTVF